MSNISDVFLVNLAQAVGISYDMKSNVLGSNTNPNSALFNVLQIASILKYGKPLFGVYEDADSFATMEFINDADRVEFQFSLGKVFYQSNLITMPSQNLPVKSDEDVAGKKLFKFYLDYNDFNLATEVYTFIITAVSTNTITVNQLPSINYLNNFKTVSINNYLFGVASINFTDKTVTLNQDVSSYASVGSTVTFIFQPVIKNITSTATSGAPPDLEIPQSGIILASAEVDISGTTTLSYSCTLGVESLFEPYPQYTNPADFFPNQSAYNAFLVTINNSVKVYNAVKKFEIESRLVNSYITYTAGIATNQLSFDQYWRSQPYKPTSLFQYGTGFQGLQKTDFDSRFKDFWYYYKNTDLTRTYSIFRGDIYGGNAYVGQALGAFPGTNAVLNLIDFTGNSTINNGTYSYGVSAVTAGGEYNPGFNSAANFYFDRRVNNYISWTASTAISDLLFFHVYKNVKDSEGFQQQRLTSPFDISGYTLSDTILSNTASYTGIGSEKFAVLIKSSDSTEGVVGGIAFNAYISDPTPLTGIQSCLIVEAGSGYISPYVLISGTGSGAAISITTTAGGGISSALVTSFGSGYTEAPTLTIFDYSTNSGGAGCQLTPVLTQLSCGIYTGTATQPSGQAVGTLQDIPVASISSSYVMNMPSNSIIGIASQNYYWAVFSLNVPYALTANQKIKFRNSSGYIAQSATSSDGVSWSVGLTSSQIAKLGYVDQGSTGTLTSSRGVYITNDQSAYPARIQLSVSNLDIDSLNFNDIGGTLGGITIVSTTPIQNSMSVYVVAENTSTGIQTTLSGLIPQGTTRGSSILLGSTTDLFDKVIDVFVVPDIVSGVNFIEGTTVINWTIYDTFTVDSVP